MRHTPTTRAYEDAAIETAQEQARDGSARMTLQYLHAQRAVSVDQLLLDGVFDLEGE